MEDAMEELSRLPDGSKIVTPEGKLLAVRRAAEQAWLSPLEFWEGPPPIRTTPQSRTFFLPWRPRSGAATVAS
jgi:hypothetical protein